MKRSVLLSLLGVGVTACGQLAVDSDPRGVDGNADSRVGFADYERDRQAQPGVDWEEGLRDRLDKQSSDENEYRRAVSD
jgi:hypothetical protein